MAAGWSPAGWKSLTTWKRPSSRGMSSAMASTVRRRSDSERPSRQVRDQLRYSPLCGPSHRDYPVHVGRSRRPTGQVARPSTRPVTPGTCGRSTRLTGVRTRVVALEAQTGRRERPLLVTPTPPRPFHLRGHLSDPGTRHHSPRHAPARRHRRPTRPTPPRSGGQAAGGTAAGRHRLRDHPEHGHRRSVPPPAGPRRRPPSRHRPPDRRRGGPSTERGLPASRANTRREATADPPPRRPTPPGRPRPAAVDVPCCCCSV